VASSRVSEARLDPNRDHLLQEASCVLAANLVIVALKSVLISPLGAKLTPRGELYSLG
jgi:hypothetical protein